MLRLMQQMASIDGETKCLVLGRLVWNVSSAASGRLREFVAVHGSDSLCRGGSLRRRCRLRQHGNRQQPVRAGVRGAAER